MIIQGTRVLTKYDLAAIEKAVNFVDTHYATKTSAPDLCLKFEIGMNEFALGFKSLTGHSLHQYIMRRRIDEAKYILENRPNASVKQVAREVGFKNAGHLSKVFKDLCGESPMQYKIRRTSTEILESSYDSCERNPN